MLHHFRHGSRKTFDVSEAGMYKAKRFSLSEDGVLMRPPSDFTMESTYTSPGRFQECPPHFCRERTARKCGAGPPDQLPHLRSRSRSQFPRRAFEMLFEQKFQFVLPFHCISERSPEGYGHNGRALSRQSRPAEDLARWLKQCGS